MDNNMEQIQAIMEAADETDSPVIVQASHGARKYSQDNHLRHLMLAATELYPHIPVVMHQDHGNSVETCMSAIDNGFTSVMMDGSLEEDGSTPADYQYNVGVTKKVVELAHAKGVAVEGELGCIGSLETGEGDKEDGHGFEGKLSNDQLLTDPDEAEQIVAETNVGALAVAIGTSHWAYKFTRKPDGEVLAMDGIEEIHLRLTNTHLVMHGSSSVRISRHHHRIRRCSNLGNSRCRDPTWHQAQRTKDQRRYGQTFGHLSGKMQVFTRRMGDYHRTRLTEYLSKQFHKINEIESNVVLSNRRTELLRRPFLRFDMEMKGLMDFETRTVQDVRKRVSNSASAEWEGETND